jgi:hypothetical protein
MMLVTVNDAIAERVMKAEAAHDALLQLFERYPLDGSLDREWKLRGRAKAEKARATALSYAKQGMLHAPFLGGELSPRLIARSCKIPEKQWRAIISLIYG